MTLSIISSGQLFAATFALAAHLLLSPLVVAFSQTNGEMHFMNRLIPWAIEFPAAWHAINISYLFFVPIAGYIVGWYLYQMLFSSLLSSAADIPLSEDEISTPAFPWDKGELKLIVGLQHAPYSMNLVKRPRYLLIDERALFQNILVTGTIGTGKTQSIMYPLLKQAIFYQADNPSLKAGMLILDVKGNFYEQVAKYAAECGRSGDMALIQLGGEYRYNPLHKPGMEAIDLAERTRQVMDMFNAGNVKKDSFWDTKAAQMITECIRLLRGTINYCSLSLVHRLVSDQSYLDDMLDLYKKIYELQKNQMIIQQPSLQQVTSYILMNSSRAVSTSYRLKLGITKKWLTEFSNEVEDISEEQSESEEYLRIYDKLHKLACILFVEDIWFVVRDAKITSVNADLLDPTLGFFSHSTTHKVWAVYQKLFTEEGASILSQLVLNPKLMPRISDFDYATCQSYFKGEFATHKAEATVETIKTVVTQTTAFFVSSERISDYFSPSKDKVSFHGFQGAINSGQIIVMAMNVAEYPQVARIIAAYLKQDFQAEVQQRTAPNRIINRERPMFFFSDEYQEFVTSGDGNFYGVSREARCCSIVATQSYTSLLKSLGGDRPSFDTLIQNMISKIALRSDDMLTIETLQKLTGKVDKTRRSRNISEAASDSSLSGVTGGLVSTRATVSESISLSTQKEALFEERDFTQTLKQFKAIAFLAAADGMQPPTMVHLLPAFTAPISTFGKEVKSP